MADKNINVRIPLDAHRILKRLVEADKSSQDRVITQLLREAKAKVAK